ATAFHDLSLYPWYQLIPSILGRGLSKLHEAAMEFQQLSRREHSAIIFLSFSWQILGIAFFYLIARAIDLDMSFESLGWIRAGLGLLLLLPISISGIGVREGGLIFLLAYFGIAPAVAIAFSFLLFARTIFLGLVGAVLEAKEILIPIESQD
ncbi:MAG: lysylphosphatidylglycerol synthase domain-containing protein, partial [Nitrospirales bacterium]